MFGSIKILTGKLPYANRTNDMGVYHDIMKGIKPCKSITYTSEDIRLMRAWDLLDKCWDPVPHSRPAMSNLCQNVSCIIGDQHMT